MLNKLVLLLVGIIVTGSIAHAASAPEIIDVSAEETCGSIHFRFLVALAARF